MLVSHPLWHSGTPYINEIVIIIFRSAPQFMHLNVYASNVQYVYMCVCTHVWCGLKFLRTLLLS
jgi:hypothetical protein